MVIKRCRLCGKLFLAEGNTQYCSRNCAEEMRRMKDRMQKEMRRHRERRKKGRRISELASINEEARKHHMSYGQYVSKFLYMGV